MLLTISTTHQPATDLGFLLHKHPDKFQSVDLSIGKAHVFYPESSNEKSTIALLLDINPIDLVRGSGRNLSKKFSLGQYVNDRPYVASSFLSVAISKAFSTAMNGRCPKRPELVDIEMPLQVKIAVLPVPRGGELLIRKMFEPLGYIVNLQRHILDEQFEQWGESKYFTVELSQKTTLKKMLNHLYVLIPALNNDKHYFVDESEIEKLLERGNGWLENHPEKEQITKRYLINLNSLAKKTLKKMNISEAITKDVEILEDTKTKKISLHQQRLQVVLEQIKQSGAKSVIDMGCGEGKLIRLLLKNRQFTKITGMDVAHSELTKVKDKLYWDDMSPRQKDRIDIFQGTLTYKDKRMEGFDAAAIVEVIEHLDENRLHSFERVVFACAKPKTVIITTPNAEYNVLYEGLEEGKFRHADHRFEWTREEFESWANKIGDEYGYKVEFLPVGDVDGIVGSPSQMGIFTAK